MGKERIVIAFFVGRTHECHEWYSDGTEIGAECGADEAGGVVGVEVVEGGAAYALFMHWFVDDRLGRREFNTNMKLGCSLTSHSTNTHKH